VQKLLLEFFVFVRMSLDHGSSCMILPVTVFVLSLTLIIIRCIKKNHSLGIVSLKNSLMRAYKERRSYGKVDQK
jgi:hypothetical protein